MKTQLYKYDGTPLFEVLVDASSSQSWSLMSDNKLSLSFELEECVVLTAGCYIEFDNTRFYLLTEYKPTMVCRSAWKYDLTLGDAASWLSITLALKTTDGENAPLFKYTGPAVEHAAIIVANLNRLMGTDKWKVGSVISTENITIDYSGKYCSEVLQEIVDTKNTEWWIDDMTLNIGRAEFGDPIELGYQNGLLGDIIREQSDNSKSYRYLYPVGSTRNIDPTKYGYDRLQLPDGRTYIDMNVEQGIAELFEEAAFAHIFPRYEGTVQTVRTQIANGNSGPFVIYYFSDSNIPFNPNDYEIAGLKKQISFLSGELMGEDFEVNYNPSSKEFEIITKYPESSNNIQLPGGLLIPNIGDKYVIWNITMPAEYYSLASQELLEAAEAFAQKYIYDGGIYHASLDYIDVQLRSLRLRPGQRVRLQSPEYFPKTGHYDSRITRVTRSLWYPNEMNIDISSERSMGVIKKLSSDVKSAQTKSNTLSATLSTLNAAFVAHKMLFDEFFEKDSAGNIHAKLSLWSSGGITAGGVGSGGSGGGGISYNRLDSWSDYSADKSGWVLSALLGNDLNTRLISVENAGYITTSALAPYALRSEIPSLEGYATLDALNTLSQTVVNFKSLFDSMFEKDSDGNIHAKLSLWSSGGITAGGVGSGGSGGGGISYNRLDSWSDYSADKSGWVLSALLGNDLNTRLISVENAGYITTSALAPYALRSEIPSLVGYATQSWVNTALSGYFLTSNFTKANIKSTLGISDWALESAKPTYTASEVGALGVNDTATNASKLDGVEISNMFKYYGFNTDLNIFKAGNYQTTTHYINSTDTAITNAPAYYGTAVNFGARVGNFQLFASNTHKLYFRQRWTSNWGDWKTLAFTSDIPTKLSQLTDDVVAGKYLSLSGGVITGQGDTRYVQLRLDGELSTVMFQQRGIEKGAVGWRSAIGVRLQNTNAYGLAVTDSNDPIYYWGENGSVQRTLLHSGNYSNLLAGGTINGGMTFASGNLIVSNGHTVVGELYPKNDGSIDLGQGSRKWKDVYLGGYLTWGNSVDSTDLGDWEALKDNIGLRIISSKTSDSGAPYQYATALHVRGRYGFELAVQGGDIDSFAIRSVTNNRGWNSLLHSGNYSSYALPITGGTVNGSITATSFIGNLTGNADSATKLATPRTIWGQSFDGTGDINGAIDVSSVTPSLDVPVIKFVGDSYFDRYGNFVLGKGAGSFSVFNESYLNAIFHVLKTGNVAIGAKTADEKLHVYGNGKFTGSVTASSLTIGGATITYDSVNEALCINGNMYALGGITAGGAGISAYTSLEARVARLEQQLNIT